MKNKIWKPSRSFLSKGHATVKLPFMQQNLCISWTFQNPKKRTLQNYTQCTMHAADKTTYGSGHGLFSPVSAIAFAEAWERLVFDLYKEDKTSPIQARSTTTGYAAGPDIESAKQSALEEYKERYLLYLAAQNIHSLKPHRPKDLISRIQIHFLEKYYAPLQCYRFESSGWGRLLLAWVKGERGFHCDSVFYKTGFEKKATHKLLSSLLASVQSHQIKAMPLPQSKLELPLQNSASLETKVLYSGGVLAPVAFSYSPNASKPYLNDFTQDDLFALLFSKMDEPSATQRCT
jgi:hypothetical protein